MGVLIPGTTSWREAIPVLVVAVALLFVPGTLAALAARARLLAAIAIGPVLTSTFLTVSGVVCGALGIRWTVPVLFVSLALCVIVVGAAGRLLSKRTTPVEGGPLLGTAVGVVVALAVFLVAMGKELPTPEAIPQHPDTIFHLGAAQWMLEHGDISVLHAAGFATPTGTGFYPAAFHDFTSSIALLTGSSVVVASSVFVITIAAIAWPLGCAVLAMSLLGRRASVAIAAAIASVCFTGYPYFLMGFGVLWPNLFGQALLPAALLLVVSVTGSPAEQGYAAAPRRMSLFLLAVSLPGLTLAHPNAFVSLCVFVAILVLGRVVAYGWRARRERGALVRNGAVGLGIVVVALGGLAQRPQGMFNTGAAGPEASAARALHDMVLFSPRETRPLVLLSVFVIAGALILLFRRPGARWVAVGLALFSCLFWVNVAVDSDAARFFTWPWYNNAVRIQAVGVLPAVIAAATAFVYVGDLAARYLRSHRPSLREHHAGLAAVGALLAVFLVVTQGYVGAHAAILHRYFHPKPADSWVTNQELRSLRALSQHIPPNEVVAANPWNGGTYLYVVSGRRLLVPTEKANTSPDRELLSRHLNEVGTNPEICTVAERQHVEWAITGGRPFSWSKGREKLYAGIDHVGTSPAWKPVASSAPYTLYERIACAR